MTTGARGEASGPEVPRGSDARPDDPASAQPVPVSDGGHPQTASAAQLAQPGGSGARPAHPGGAGTGTASAARPYVATLLGVAAFVLAADAISKAVVVAGLSGRPPVRLLGGLLTLRLLRNSGAAFSLGTSMTIVFTAIAAGVIVCILRTVRRLRSLRWAVTLGLLLGGATGNLADRLFRAPAPFRGSVVDWIQLPHWPVFNLADSAIVCGGALAVLLAARGLRVDGTREAARPPGPRYPGGPSGQPRQPGQAGQAAQPGQASQPSQSG